MSARFVVPLLVFLLAASPACAQEADWPALRAHCRELVENLDALGATLPAPTLKALAPLLKQGKPDDPEQVSRDVQALLDPHCLLTVNVNPQSRVKAARGPLRAALTLDQAAYVLVKVNNEGGVTHALSVDSPQLSKGKGDEERWLEAAVQNGKPFANRLSGERIEYRVLKLTARQAGRREATLAFDVGQGSQDLGFRAETPILFAVAKK